MSDIRPVSNLREYFRQSVTDAMKRNRVNVDEHTSFYLVNLLTLYARSEELFEQGESGPELRPVASLLADAVGRGQAERNRALQRVGDQSLFIAGFFADGLKTRLVDIDYYIDMGGSAYATLSSSVAKSAREQAISGVYAELAERFLDLVDVLNELREQSCQKPTDVLRLYDIWTRTGSPRAARQLRAQGIEPVERLRKRHKPH